MLYHYQAYGLFIESEFECPGLTESEGKADIRVRLKSSDHNPSSKFKENSYHISKSDHFELYIHNLAHFEVNHGSDIFITPHPAGNEKDILLYLLGSIFAVAIMQRGDLLLHASTVVKKGTAIMFAGESGIGKSTLAHALVNERNWTLSADDVSRISNVNNIPHTLPAYPFVKLHKDVLKTYSISEKNLAEMSKKWGKYRMPHVNSFSSEPTPITTIFCLQKDSDNNLDSTSICGPQKLILLRNLLYRPQYLSGTIKEKDIFLKLSVFVQKTKVIQLSRPDKMISLKALNALMDKVEANLSNQEITNSNL